MKGAQRVSWRKPTSFHCSQVVDPDIDERIHQLFYITPKRFSEAVVHFLGMPQILYKSCTGFTGGTSHLFGGLELTAVPFPDVIVGGIPSCVSFGGIQLVWHLAELSKQEASQTPLDVKPAIGLQRSGSSALQCLVDSDCPMHPCHLGYL